MIDRERKAKMLDLLNKIPYGAKRIEMIGADIHITISGHGETSTKTANNWIGVLSKIGKTSHKETIEESCKMDRQHGIVDYVKVTKVWCRLLT